jgi:ABC-type phosphate/phosphonate transport system substrate-binding protein
MLKEFTGLEARLAKRESLAAVGASLAAGTDQFAILQGTEYGWLKAKHPDIQPLLIGIYYIARPRAILLTKKEDPAKSFADLKGKSVGILKAGKDYLYLFARKQAGGDLGRFFDKVVETSKSEPLLDDLLRGKFAAVVVDQASLDVYREVQPGRFARLRVVEESAPFPPMALFYVPNKVAPEVVQKFRTGMLNANSNARSRDAMETFKITAFQPVPAEYETWVADIVKAYPQKQ